MRRRKLLFYPTARNARCWSPRCRSETARDRFAAWWEPGVTSRNASSLRNNFANPKKWRRLASWRVAWLTISTTSSPSLWATSPCSNSRNPLNPEQAAGLVEIAKAAERAANLTRQLLTFSRRQLFQPKPLDLNEVVANTSKMLQRLIGEHIGLETHFAPGGAPVMADRTMMEQILINLAVNSRDAMPKGGRLIIQTAAIVISEADAQANPKARPGAFIRLKVTDTGCGIAPKEIARIFEPFFTTKEVGKGTGLGLATVFGIVAQHHGWIEVESKVNAGATFYIYLPRLPESEKSQTEFTRAPEVRGGKETILLVEDEAPVRSLARTLLERKGYHVIEADSGLSALEIWQEQRDAIDLLFTDMVMPEGISGRELAARLLAEKPGLKVIYSSGYTDDMLGESSPLRNNPNFLEKPFDSHKLLKRVRDCLDGVTGN